jgi:hypothetical protein
MLFNRKQNGIAKFFGKLGNAVFVLIIPFSCDTMPPNAAFGVFHVAFAA